MLTTEPQQCIARPPSPRHCEGGNGGSNNGKDFTERTLKSLKVSLGKLWRRRTVSITEYDPTYKCAYLGNVLTGWAKGEGCVEKPLSTLWKNYTSSSKADVQMKVSVTHSGLKAVTKEHGLTEYWSHRVTYCAAPAAFPRIFCWVYRHEGRKLKQELRCHAVLCTKEAVARRMAAQLRSKLAQALHEFKRDKICRQNARLSLANSVYDNPSLPRRKILLSTGSHNYRPPLERSKSAPKLMAIEESLEEEQQEEAFESPARCNRLLLRLNSVPLARDEMKHLSPTHIARMFQRVSPRAGRDKVAGEECRRHVFDVTPVREEEEAEVGGGGGGDGGRLPLTRRNSGKRVGWALDQSERLLVLGRGDEAAEELGESDENSLQSISSSGSDTSSTGPKSHEPCTRQRSAMLDPCARQCSLPALYQDQRTSPTCQEETDVLEEVVDPRPTGGSMSELKRSMTFPPPPAPAHAEELDSLSDEEEEDEEEEDEGKGGEETESDESGYAELTEKDFAKTTKEKERENGGGDGVKEKDGSNRIIKSILRPNSRNSQCVQV